MCSLIKQKTSSNLFFKSNHLPYRTWWQILYLCKICPHWTYKVTVLSTSAVSIPQPSTSEPTSFTTSLLPLAFALPFPPLLLCLLPVQEHGEQGAPEAQRYSPQTAPCATAALSTAEQAPRFNVFFSQCCLLRWAPHQREKKKKKKKWRELGRRWVTERRTVQGWVGHT